MFPHFTSPVPLSLSSFLFLSPILPASHDPLHHGIEVRAGLGRATWASEQTREATLELLKVKEEKWVGSRCLWGGSDGLQMTSEGEKPETKTEEEAREGEGGQKHGVGF